MVGSMGLVNDKDPKVVELNAWYQKHNELFFNAFEAASKDENEEVRWFALGGLAGRDPQHVSILSTLTAAIESDSSTRVRSMAIDLLTRNDVKSVAKSQNIELAPILVKTLESDTSIDVRYSALGALMQMDAASELVHSTLLKWAKSQDRVEVKYALTLMHRNQADGDRPQSIDELVELLTNPEWGTAVEVAENNWETYHRWARQYAIAILGRYTAHAHLALPTLDAELARNNKDTLTFAAKALDSVRGYCPDRPVDQLQGQWEFVSVNRPNSTTAFFDFPLHDGGVYPAVGRELRTASSLFLASNWVQSDPDQVATVGYILGAFHSNTSRPTSSPKSVSPCNWDGLQFFSRSRRLSFSVFTGRTTNSPFRTLSSTSAPSPTSNCPASTAGILTARLFPHF